MKTRRIMMSLCGVLICAVSVGIFKLAALGVDPFQSLMSGLDQLIPISFGTLYVIVNLILLSFSLLTDRHNFIHSDHRRSRNHRYRFFHGAIN